VSNPVAESKLGYEVIYGNSSQSTHNYVRCSDSIYRRLRTACKRYCAYEYGFSQTPGGPYTKIVPDTDFTPDAQGKQTASLDLSGFAFGQWYAASRAVTTAALGSQASVWSSEAAFLVQAKTPEAPRNFSVA
jgi:hypothetical protein